uniref:Scavenger receptor class F member 2 n=1 Tax=Magallana gigas TaxID=29159 RepID=A0A8W8JLT6_MAGGI
MFEKIHNKSFRLIVLQILTFGIRHSFEDIPRCVGYPFECCPGYMWNYRNNICEQCMAGYIGRNCTSKCPFPYYGVECQQNCKCNQSLCNISTGCIAAAMPSGVGTYPVPLVNSKKFDLEIFVCKKDKEHTCKKTESNIKW